MELDRVTRRGNRPSPPATAPACRTQAAPALRGPLPQTIAIVSGYALACVSISSHHARSGRACHCCSRATCAGGTLAQQLENVDQEAAALTQVLEAREQFDREQQQELADSVRVVGGCPLFGLPAATASRTVRRSHQAHAHQSDHPGLHGVAGV
jgi:hypothetical protein